jgi:hypothetical protein
MENFLPILIGIIWVAYTLYSKGQKKKNIRPSDAAKSHEAKPLSLFEQILMGGEIKQPQSYMDYEEPEEPEPVVQPIKMKEKPRQTPKPFLTEELAEFIHEGQTATEYYSQEKTIAEILMEQEQGPVEIDFDLQRAVIYSEILNAPYINYK